jgi:hypothetical protein
MNIDEFMKNVGKTGSKACEYGKYSATTHYSHVSGCSESEAEALYLSVKLAVSDAVVALRCKVQDVKQIVASQRLGCLVDRQNAKRNLAEKLMNIDDFGTIYADCRNSEDPICGECLFVLSNVKEAVCFNGELARLTNSEREDYVIDPSLLLYPIENMADCKAASIVGSIPLRDAAMGSDRILAMIVDRTYEVGHAQVMMFAEPKLDDVESITASAHEDVVSVRRGISELGFLIPVHLSVSGHEGHFPKTGTDMHFEKDDRSKESARPIYMRVGERIAMKPLPTQPRKLGRIVGCDGSMVSVHWDDDTKGIYDSAEALMRLMPAPQTDLVRPMVPGHGLDEVSSHILGMNGIDPDVLYSMLSYLKPAAASSGWKERVLDGLARFGLSAQEIKGFKPTSYSFEPAEWIEAGLWSGDRLVVDMSPTSLAIEVGDADDYIVPFSMPMAEIE